MQSYSDNLCSGILSSPTRSADHLASAAGAKATHSPAQATPRSRTSRTLRRTTGKVSTLEMSFHPSNKQCKDIITFSIPWNLATFNSRPQAGDWVNKREPNSKAPLEWVYQITETAQNTACAKEFCKTSPTDHISLPGGLNSEVHQFWCQTEFHPVLTPSFLFSWAPPLLLHIFSLLLHVQLE